MTGRKKALIVFLSLCLYIAFPITDVKAENTTTEESSIITLTEDLSPASAITNEPVKKKKRFFNFFRKKEKKIEIPTIQGDKSENSCSIVEPCKNSINRL